MNLILRPATMDDAKMLLQWRNDPDTRANSINTGEVEWGGHVAWLERVLSDPNRKLLVAMNGETPIGTIRLDGNPGKGEIELSWTIAPDERGKGYGGAMVALSLKHLVPGKRVLAQIKPQNEPSRRIVLRLGFQLISTDNGLENWWLER